MHTLVLVAHVFLAVGMTILILLQRGKGADAGTAFGAGASGTVFGSRGTASFFSRTTAVMATLFFVTSLTLAFFGARPQAPVSVIDRAASETAPGGGSSELGEMLPVVPEELPALPGTELPAPETPPADEALPETE